MVAELVDSPDRFRNWLKEFLLTETVGVSGSSIHCPVACFLADTLGVDEVEVYPDAITTPQEAITTPQWVQDFMETVDEEYAPGNALDERYIMTYEALKVLDDMEAETR